MLSAHNKHFLFVGNRLEVLYEMLQSCPNLTICLQANTYAANSLQNELSYAQKLHYFEFSNKQELLELITSLQFDVLLSNGCPYILPISALKKLHPDALFINCHPSLLPNLKGAHPINGAILYNQPSGATCHIMTDKIDSGEIISQVPVYNDSSTPLALLYQMCFLAEREAFKLALKRDFKIADSLRIESKPYIAYFTRKAQDLALDFTTQSTQELISTIKAFARVDKGAYLAEDKTISFIDAKLIQNEFLDRIFKYHSINDILLHYDNHILCKRKEGFLELTSKEKIKHLADFSRQNIRFEPITKPIFSTQDYSKALSNRATFDFTFTQDKKCFTNTAIIEPIANSGYYDMSSPYGYAGYMSNSNHQAFLHLALKAQAKKARDLGIIAEFIRFHPFAPFTRYFAPLLDFFKKERDIVIVSTDSNQRLRHYSPRLKTKLSKASSSLLIAPSKNLNAFMTLYTSTMERNKASAFYFFKPSYFEALLQLPQTLMLEARYKGQIVAMGIFLFDSLCGYYHLGANARQSLQGNLNAMGALFEAFFEIAKAKGLSYCILGGGRSASPEDSLFLFKKQFATALKPFYIGGYIYNHPIYNQLKASAQHSSLFLSYRANEVTLKQTSNHVLKSGLKPALKPTGGGRTYPYYSSTRYNKQSLIFPLSQERGQMCVS